MDDPPRRKTETDWARQPLGTIFWWILPATIAIAAGPLHMPLRVVAAIWAAAFVWMGIGCLLNALRCHRLHCYISAPVLLAGAIAASLLASGLLQASPRTLTYGFWSVFGLVVLSFAPEAIWRKYV